MRSLFGSVFYLLILIAVVFFAVGFFLVYLPVDLKTPEPSAGLKVSPEVSGENLRYQQDRNFLSEFRLERERERSRLQERLEELLATADEESAREIHDKLWELAKRSAMEIEVENLLKARGYSDIAVAIYPGSVTVVIKGSSLVPEAVSAIGALVADVTGYPLEQIRILE